MVSLFQKAFLPGNWEWLDDPWTVTLPLLRVLATNLLVVVGILFGCRSLFSFFQRVAPDGASDGASDGAKFQWPNFSAALIVVFLITGIFPARLFVAQPLALERLYAAMGCRLGVFTPDQVTRRNEAAFGGNYDQAFEPVAASLLELCTFPADFSMPALQTPKIRPHVVLLILESLQYDLLADPCRMPQLAKWAEQGTVAQQHYCNSNCSTFGSFALLYGRYPLSYNDALQRNIGPAANTARHAVARRRVGDRSDFARRAVGAKPAPQQWADSAVGIL